MEKSLNPAESDKVNVQLENGYTKIANELLEVIYRTGFNATQLKIILCLIRYTYGFGRKEHEISISFLSKATGISRRYISSELNKLIDAKVIITVENYSVTSSRKLSLNKDYSQWVGYRTIRKVNNTSTGEEQFNTTGEELFNTTGEELFTQEINNKENIKDNIQSDNQLSFMSDGKIDTIVMTSEESEFIKVLETISNYKSDRKKDLDFYKTLQERYPSLDLVQAIKAWKIYKLDKPLTDKSNPRSQINTSFKKYVEWGKYIKTSKKPDKIKEPQEGPAGVLPYESPLGKRNVYDW